MTEKAKIAIDEAFRRLRELHLHHLGPKHALRAVARLVIANKLRGDGLKEAFEHDASGLQMKGDPVIQQVLTHLTSKPDEKAPQGIRVVLPNVANDNGHSFQSLATCVRN